MPRYLSLVGALALALVGGGQSPPQKSAFDKALLETYVRHVWVLGPEFQVTIGDPKPSAELSGFQEITVRVSNATAGQDVKVYVSQDGSKIFQGNVYDVNFNPFKKDLDKLKTQGRPSFGTPGAPVVIVDFSDMQCPHCKDEAKMIREHLAQQYPTQVRFYYADFPLDTIHPWARPAAIAGRCVFRQSALAFWNYHDWVFEHQESISKDNLKDQVMEWAKGQKGIDALQLSRCMDGRLTEKEVDASVAEAKELQVDGVPTLFINGRRVGPSEWEELKRIVDAEIAYQAIAKDAGEDCGCDAKIEAPGLPSRAAPGLPKK